MAKCIKYGKNTYKPNILFDKIRSNPEFFAKKHGITGSDVENVLGIAQNDNVDFQIPAPQKPKNLMPKSLIANIADTIRNGGKGAEVMNVVNNSNWFKGLGESTQANMTFNDVKATLIDSDRYHKENDKVKAKERTDARLVNAKNKTASKFNEKIAGIKANYEEKIRLLNRDKRDQKIVEKAKNDLVDETIATAKAFLKENSIEGYILPSEIPSLVSKLDNTRTATDKNKALNNFFDNVEALSTKVAERTAKKEAELQNIKDKAKEKIQETKEKSEAKLESVKQKSADKLESVKSAKEVVIQEINNALDNGSFKGNTKQSVIATVAKKLTKAVTLSENKSILNYIKKVIANADYNSDLQNAKSNQSKIRKVASSKTFSRAKTNVNIAKAFARLNPNNVSDIKEYNRIASQILNNLKGLKINANFEVSGEDYKISNEEIEAYTDKEFERALKLADERKRDNFQDKVDEGLIPEGMTYEEYSEITDVKNEEDYLAKQKELSAEKKKQVLGIAKSLVDTKKGELKNYADDNKGTFTEAEEKVLNSLDKIPTENLSLEQLVKINDIINNIVTNNSFSDSLGIASLQQSIENFANLEEKIKTKGWIFSRLSTEGLNGIWQGLVSNDMLVEYIARLPKAAAELKRFSGISKVVDGNAKAKIEQQKIYSEFEGLRNTLSKEVGVNLNTTDSRIHRGIIARLFQNFGGSLEENQAEFNRQKGLIKDHYEKLVARSKTDKAYEKQIKEGEAVKSFYEKYVDGVDNLPDFVKGLTSAEQKANLKMVKFWVDKFATYKDLFFEQSDMLNNKPLEDIGNYTATKEKNFDGVIDDKALEDYLTNRFFGNPSINVKPSGAKNNRVRQRSLGVNKLLNLDFDFIQNDVMHTNLHDLYTSDGVSELRNFFANPNTEKLLGGKHNYDLLKSQMEQTIQHQRGNLQFTNNKAMKALNKGLEVLQAKGARSALASFTQFAKQYLSVSFNLFGNLGTDVDLVIDAIKMSNSSEFFNSKNIGLRGSTKAGFNKESIFRQDDSNLRSAFENNSSQLYELLMKPLEMSDVSIARTSWLAFYMKDLRKRGVKFTTDEIMSEGYKLDEEASAYAEQMVSINQNANDASSMASAFKNTDTAMQFIKNVFLPFSTFATNQRARMTLDFKNVINGSTEQRKESAKSLVATMAEQAVFNGIKIALNYALTVAGISASKMIGLIDDDDEERAKKFLKEGLWNKFKMNTINDMFFTGMGSLTEKGLQTVTNEAFKITDNKPPFFIFDGSNEPGITSDWGVYSSGVKLYYNFGNDIYKLAKPYKTVVGGGYETKIVEIDGELPKEARNAYALNLVIDGLTLFGMSDQTVSTVNNRIRRDADKFVLDNLGGKKIEITSPVNASKRSVGFAKDVLNKEKTIAQVNKEIDAIKGFSEKQKTGIKNSVALRVKFPDVDKVLFDVKFTTDYTKKAEMLINAYSDNDLTDQSPESKKIIAQMVKIGGVNFPEAKYIQLLKDKKASK